MGVFALAEEGTISSSAGYLAVPGQVDTVVLAAVLLALVALASATLTRSTRHSAPQERGGAESRSGRAVIPGRAWGKALASAAVLVALLVPFAMLGSFPFLAALALAFGLSSSYAALHLVARFLRTRVRLAVLAIVVSAAGLGFFVAIPDLLRHGIFGPLVYGFLLGSTSASISMLRGRN